MRALLDAPDVVMTHLQRHSIRFEVGDCVGRGQQLARVGNSGDCGEPHLHMQVQNRPYDYRGDESNLYTFPMTFRRAHVTPGGSWPRADAGELRSGDRIRSPSARSWPASGASALGNPRFNHRQEPV